MDTLLRISPELSIPLTEISETFIRATGPGGQHVNKSSTAVQLRFDVQHSPSLTNRVRARLTAIAGNRMTGSGVLILTAQRFRSREQNRRDALDRLAQMLRRAVIEPKKRRRTKPSRAAKQRRLDEKKRRGSTKRLRSSPAQDS